MPRNDRSQALSQRNPGRQWLGIEICAYVLLCVSLITVAWTQHQVSGVVALAAWVLAGFALTLAARRIYRTRQRR